MTQELIIWVLLGGSVGLIWVLTCALLTQDRSRHQASGAESAGTDTQASRSNHERPDA